MTKNIQSDNPDVASQESGEEEITEASLINSLAGNLSAPTESKEPKEESEESETEETEELTEPEAEAEDVGDSEEESEEEETEEESEETEEEDVLSQIDVDALSKEEKIELAKMLGSEVGKDIGRLRSEGRQKDEQIAKLEKELQESISQVLPSDNQFSSVTDAEKLNEKAKEVEANISAAINFLQGDEDYIQVGDKEVDRKTVGGWLQAYQAQEKDIQKQRERLKELSGLSEASSKEMEKAKSELTWLDDEESDAYKSFSELKNDSDIDLVKRISPKLGAKMERILAHAANSLSGAKTPKKKFALKRKAKPVSGKLGAGSNKPGGKSNKKLEAARQRIKSGEATEQDIILAAFN